MNFSSTVWGQVRMDRLVAALRIPGLVIHDEHDDDVAIAEGKSIAAAWPGARFMRTSGLGHSRILRDTTVFQAVVEFVQGSPGSDGAF